MTRILVPMWSAVAMLFLAPPAPCSLFRIDNPTPTASALFGGSVAALGDQNADGVADLAIGAPGADRVDILSGADRTVIRSLQDPEGVGGMEFGKAVTGVGDVTADGVEDVAVGAPGPFGLLPLPCIPDVQQCPPPEWGRVFLFSGADGVLIRKLAPTGDFFAFGYSLAPLGDVNSDGTPDLAVGAPVFLNSWGEVYAFSGATGAQLWRAQEPPAPGVRQEIASLGQFVAPIGDVNADGTPDLLAAAPFHDNDPTDEYLLGGAAFVLSGADGSVPRSHQAVVPVHNGLYGGAVSGIGDQNADGVPDYLVGHRGNREVLLYSGATGALLGAIALPASATIQGGLVTLARAGDRDGDLKEDFWVGTTAGSTVYLLNAQGTVLQEAADPGVPAAADPGKFGVALAAVPDMNGDGKPELLIGKAGETVNGQAGAGAAFLLTSNRPPTADAGPDQTVAAGSGCQASVTLDGSGSSDPDGDALTYTWSGPFGTVTGATPEVSLGLGTHTVTLTVDDSQGGTDTDTVDITVADLTPPTITRLTASPNTLWPPDHRMVAVALTVAATDNCDATPATRIIGVSSSQPENGRGDGDTGQDWEITGDLTLNLRAERSGTGGDRIYTVTVQAADDAGNTSTASVTVTVPRGGVKP